MPARGAMTETAALLLDLALSRATTLGAGRLVRLDGPSGSGKTTLATRLAALAAESHVVHLDDLYDGWAGLPGVGAQLDTLLLPLSRGASGTYRRYDWHAGAFAETVRVAPTPLLVLEGVGAGSPVHERLATVTCWVDAPEDLRRSRALERDGTVLAERWAEHWAAWATAEAAYFTGSRVAERADLHVDGSGACRPRLRVP